jgi:ribose 5-phosphate isomerase B
MTEINDAEIHNIVQKVVEQALGSSARESVPAVAASQAGLSTKKIVAIGADHGGFELKEALKKDLTALGFEINDVGTNSKDAVDYPDFAHAVAQTVSSGKAWRGIMIDGAGIGSCIVANKVPGVRAGMAYDYSSAVNSREHNDTNVLTLGAGLIGVNLAKQIVKTWLTTEFAGGRHTPRVDKIKSVEKKYLK